MSDEKTRSHGHWKRWGWSLTCSICGHVGEGGDYCEMCGSIMDEPEEWWNPPIHVAPLIIRACPSCGETVYGAVNYCKYCGVRMNGENKND